MTPQFRRLIIINAGIAATTAILLVIKSLMDFSHTGPEIRHEIMDFYSGYAAYAMGRLAIWVFLIAFLLSGFGMLLYACTCTLRKKGLRPLTAAICGATSLGGLTLLAFLHQLLYIPSSIVTSWNYDIQLLLPVWRILSPSLLTTVDLALLTISLAIFISTILTKWRAGKGASAGGLTAILTGIALLLGWANWDPDAPPISDHPSRTSKLPNIVMIGSDTLRGDRLGAMGYPRKLTPFIDKLAKQRGVQFTNAFVPIARTAPSITTLLTGTWPHNHRIRDNYISDEDSILPVQTLPKTLKQAGYETAVVGDWAAGDHGKLSFGFQYKDVADDQWNIKYLMRQGPKDIRLFLTLFTHNHFGKVMLPELYYLASVPLTTEVGKSARRTIRRLAQTGRPFFLDIFIATTHAPFGSEYPYYTLYSDPAYSGDSKFVISGLTDPESIIKRQEEGKDAFDLQQIIDLYDGAVRRFDDEVNRIITYIDESGLSDSTIIVIYSDHGIDLFERSSWGQGNSVMGTETSGRIPLIIIDPAHRSNPHIVPNIVRTVDLVPTLLDLIGREPPSDVDGVSLKPYLDGAPVDLNLVAFQETGLWLGNNPELSKLHIRYPSLLKMLEVRNKQTGTLSLKKEFRDKVITAKDRMMRTDEWKVVYMPLVTGGKFYLFNIIDDPQCRHDVATKFEKTFLSLTTRLRTWLDSDPQRELRNGLLVRRDSINLGSP